VSLRERVPGARLQEPLEAHRHRLSPELDAHVDEPRPPPRRRPILSCIVGSQARRGIGGDAYVAPIRMGHAANDVDESLGREGHTSS